MGRREKNAVDCTLENKLTDACCLIELMLEDCSDRNGALVAPEKSCFVKFVDIYNRFMERFSLNEKILPLMYHPILKFKDVSREVKVSYQMRRNFSNWEFTKYMRHSDVTEL